MFDWLKSWTLMATDWPKSWAPMVIDCWTKSWTSRRSRWIPCHLLPSPPRPPLLAFELLPPPPLPHGLALLYSGLEFALVLGAAATGSARASRASLGSARGRRLR